MATFTRPPIALETLEVVDASRVVETFQARLQSRPSLRRLSEVARQRGLEVLGGDENVVGYRETIKGTKEIVASPHLMLAGDPRGISEVRFEILGRSLVGAASDDQGAIISTTLTRGEGVDSYDILLVAPRGDWGKAREWVVVEPAAGLGAEAQAVQRPSGPYIDMPTGGMGMGTAAGVPGDVIEAESWWSAFRACLGSRCGSACLSALVTCSGTWAAYFWCLVARCGGCVLRCSACSTCDCRWWCRWAVGCCDR